MKRADLPSALEIPSRRRQFSSAEKASALTPVRREAWTMTNKWKHYCARDFRYTEPEAGWPTHEWEDERRGLLREIVTQI